MRLDEGSFQRSVCVEPVTQHEVYSFITLTIVMSPTALVTVTEFVAVVPVAKVPFLTGVDWSTPLNAIAPRTLLRDPVQEATMFAGVLDGFVR